MLCFASSMDIFFGIMMEDVVDDDDDDDDDGYCCCCCCCWGTCTAFVFAPIPTPAPALGSVAIFVEKSDQFIIVDRDQEKGVENKHQLTISTYEGEMHSEPPMRHENNYLGDTH